MRKTIAGILALTMLLALPVNAAWEDPVVETQARCDQDIKVGAKAAIVMEVKTGRVLFAQNERERLPMASTTKIMTSLIALEQNNVNAMFEVDPLAIRVEGSSMGLREGDQASLYALAAGMLLHSGNDAANAVAVRISGSIPDFAVKMNARAGAIGMRDTSFETPSGLDGGSHYSTAYDMALLAREALSNDAFAAICSQYKLRANYGNPPYNRWLKNHNKLLSIYDGTFGVKTGFTKKSGRCLVSAARRDGIELICVTLNCPDDWSVHRNLYDRFFDKLTLKNLTDDLPETNVPVVGGVSDMVSAIPYEEAFVAVPKEGANIRHEVIAPHFLYAPVRQGQYLGDLRVFLDDDLVFTLSLAAERDVPLLHQYKESLWERITDWAS